MATKATNQRPSSMDVVSVQEFKSLLGVPEAKGSVVRNPNTGKLFLSVMGKGNFKVQQDFNPELPYGILIPDGVLEEACLINSNNDNTIMEL